MNQSYFHRVSARTPTRFWINNPTRAETDLAIAAGAVGCTQNPSFVQKMLAHPDERAYTLGLLDGALKETQDGERVQEILQRELVRATAAKFLPLYEKSQGRLGYVSIQGSPLREDPKTLVESARFNRQAGPNIMAKVPLTEAGLEAIEALMLEGVPINATEVMGVRQALDVCDVYDRVAARIKHPPVVFFSHITGIYDEYLAAYVKERGIRVSPDSLWQAGMLIAHKIRRLVSARGSEVGFIGGGARGLHHFTEMVGAESSITINWAGTADKLLEQNPPVADRFHAAPSDAVLDELLEKVEDFRRGWMINGLEPHEYEEFGPVVLFRNMFISAWRKALEIIEARKGKA